MDRDGGYKFIVAIVWNRAGNRNKMVIRADGRYYYHKELLEEFSVEVRPLCAHCVGGGRIHVDASARKIYIWEESSEFGTEPSREETARMIRAAFPDYEVILASPK